MPNIDLSILNQRQTPAFYADVFANRPAAGFVGRIFVSTNTFAFYRDNGTGWDLIGGPGTGTITGSGATGQTALWDGASTITGDTGLTYDGTANSLTASKFIVTGGLSTQFLKGDGSLDSNTYNTGSGVSGQVTYWNGTNAITGNTNLFYDAGNNRLGINTNVPSTVLDVHSSIANPIIHVNQTGGTNNTTIAFLNSGAGKWRIGSFYNAGAEDFGIFDIVGNIQPVTVKKTTGQVLIGTSTVGSGKLVVASATGDNHIQIVGATAPSLRIDSAESGPTKRAGFGIATATNNFIQGSADRDFCMFNGSTTASPILFGIYNAGTVNVQEAARISAARNFLIGTTTDAGYKLRVNGTGYFDSSIITANGNVAVFNGGSLEVYNSGTTNYFDIKSTGGNFALRTNVGLSPINALTIASTGAATFSSFIKAKYYNVTGSNGLAGYLIQQGDWAGTAGQNLSLVAENGLGISFFTNGQATNVNMFLNSSGNLLIGTTTDNGSKLQVNGSAYITGTQNNVGNKIMQVSYYGNSQRFVFQSNFDNPTNTIFTYNDVQPYAQTMIKITCIQNAVTGDTSGGSVWSIGYALIVTSPTGTIARSSVSSMVIQGNFTGTNIGTLSWSGGNLQYTANRMSNYDAYVILVEYGTNTNSNTNPSLYVN